MDSFSHKSQLFLFFLIALLFILSESQIPPPDLDLNHNEKEYFNDSIFDEMNLEEETLTETSGDSTGPDIDADAEENEAEEEDDKNIMKEWEDYMKDFVPADMLTYEIEKNQREVLYFIEKIRKNALFLLIKSRKFNGKLVFFYQWKKMHFSSKFFNEISCFFSISSKTSLKSRVISEGPIS